MGNDLSYCFVVQIVVSFPLLFFVPIHLATFLIYDTVTIEDHFQPLNCEKDNNMIF